MVDLTFSLSELEYFLLIVVRVTGFIFAAPFFSMANVPRRVRIAFGVLLSYMLYKMMDPVSVEYNTVLGYAIIVIKETLTGVLIGYSANICTQILNFAGQLVDMEVGLSSAQLYDATTKETVTISGFYYQYTVMLMLFISGMYQYVLAALVSSYSLIPVNGAVFSSENIVSAMAEFLGDYLSLGFRICLPVFITILLINSILGILTKVSPQIHMFSIGMQIKILAGLGVMFVTVGILPTASTLILSEMKKMVTLFMEAMA